ncbi:MAG TPA: trypsin-like peptidase domain-containing protein [Pilimelia sp.]|nr:trypsin-like peptidase domain-containing protein [Pilimelia sp.]
MTDKDAVHGDTQRIEPAGVAGAPEPAPAVSGPPPPDAAPGHDGPAVGPAAPGQAPAEQGGAGHAPYGDPAAAAQAQAYAAAYHGQAHYGQAHAAHPYAAPQAHAGTGPYDNGAGHHAAGGYGAGHGDAHTGSWPAAAGAPPERRRGRTGLVAAVAGGALVLSLLSGVSGALIANSVDDDPVSLAATADTGGVVPVLNRESLAKIAADVTPSVVSISTGQGEGSGVLISEDGYIITNEHVVRSARNGTVSVTFKNGSPVPSAKVVGTDPATDLGLVKVDGVSGIKPASLGNSSGINVGDTVLAVGSPLGLQGSVTAGIISATNRTIPVNAEDNPFGQSGGKSLGGLIQTDAPINPGNSGGALVNMAGEVIGINSAIATAGSQGNIGVGFAIPSNRAKAVTDQLKAGKKVSHAYIGINLADAETSGALVSAVQPGSPAAKAGLAQGDIITDMGGRPIRNPDDLISAVQSANVGDKVVVTYTRAGKQNKATVTLEDAN